MTRTEKTLAAIILIGLLGILLAASARGAPDKQSPEPFCSGSDPGYCNPVDDPAKAIPPDLPPEAKLRAQILKERKAHRAEVRALRAEIVRLGGGR